MEIKPCHSLLILKIWGESAFTRYWPRYIRMILVKRHAYSLEKVIEAAFERWSLKIVVHEFWKSKERWLILLVKSVIRWVKMFSDIAVHEPATFPKDELFHRYFLRILSSLNGYFEHIRMSVSEVTQMLEEAVPISLVKILLWKFPVEEFIFNNFESWRFSKTTGRVSQSGCFPHCCWVADFILVRFDLANIS